jgi:hypothetical protein
MIRNNMCIMKMDGIPAGFAFSCAAFGRGAAHGWLATRTHNAHASARGPVLMRLGGLASSVGSVFLAVAR